LRSLSNSGDRASLRKFLLKLAFYSAEVTDTVKVDKRRERQLDIGPQQGLLEELGS